MLLDSPPKKTTPTLIAACLGAGLVLALLLAPSIAIAQCTICDPCTDSSQCALGEMCAQFASIGGRCVADCSLGQCPGDSTCWNVDDEQGNTVQLCLNPTADQQLCPSTYSCGGGSGGACLSLGLDCTISPDICGPLGGDYCINTGSEAFCSCSCASSADCGDGAVCSEIQAGTFACIPGSTTGPCEGVMCGAGEVCDPNTGTCVQEGGGDLCDGVTCPGGGVCSPATGTCIGGTMEVPMMEEEPMDMGPTDLVISQDTVSDTGQPDQTTQPDSTTQSDTGNMAQSNTIEAEGECACRSVRVRERQTSWPIALILMGAFTALIGYRRRS